MLGVVQDQQGGLGARQREDRGGRGEARRVRRGQIRKGPVAFAQDPGCYSE